MKILFENKQLNEGPGAGYTVSGTLANVKVNKIEYINKMDKNSDLVEYEVGLDATADFEDVSANSYYYGGTLESTPVAIDKVVVEFDDGDITESDVKWAIESAKIEANLGGGWSHSTFNGRIDVDYMSIENASYLNAISFELTDERAVTYLDKAVQNGNEETLYAVMDEDDWIMDSFDNEEDAIAYAKEHGLYKVQIVYQTESFDGDFDVDRGDVVWTADEDDMDESLKESEDSVEKETEDGLGSGSAKEMSNVIFDTLFNNTQYPQFDISKVENQEVDASRGQIVFDYMGHEYKITVEESAGHFTESASKPLTEGFDEDERIQALAEYLGINPSEISNIYDLEFETPEGDYLVVDEDEAEVFAKEDIESLFDDLGLDSFTPDFKDWIIMNALDNDWFEEAVRESYEYYVEDIEDESSSMGYENRLIEEMHDHQVLSDDDFVVGEDGEPDLTTLNDDVDIDDLKEEFIDLLVENAGNAVDYCGDNFGWDWVTQMATQHGLIDMNEVVEQCIYMDGVAHFIARYDGEEHDLGNGLFAYRTN